MNIENLNQFNKRLFNKYFGNYIKERRLQLGYSIEDLLKKNPTLNREAIKLIESGRRPVSQIEFDLLVDILALDQQELTNIVKLTQINKLLNIYMEINENYPK